MTPKPCAICGKSPSHSFLFCGKISRICWECQEILGQHDWVGLADRILEGMAHAVTG